MSMRRRSGAFTLLEVLLVIALLSLLALLVWPDFRGETQMRQLHESARRFKTLIAMCRAQAMNEGVRYRLTFRQDGTVLLTHEVDPILAPQVFVRVRTDWSRIPVLLDDVWVESIADLPDGLSPVRVHDELIEFDEFEPELIPSPNLEAPLAIDFLPDGQSASVMWLIRHAAGNGLKLTLDGRLGRVTIEPVEALDAGVAVRPDPLEDDYDEEAERRVLEALKDA